MDWYNEVELTEEISKHFNISHQAASYIYRWYDDNLMFELFDSAEKFLLFVDIDYRHMLCAMILDKSYSNEVARLLCELFHISTKDLYLKDDII